MFQVSTSQDKLKLMPHLSHNESWRSASVLRLFGSAFALDAFRFILLSSLISLVACDDFNELRKAVVVSTAAFSFFFFLLFLDTIFGSGLITAGEIWNGRFWTLCSLRVANGGRDFVCWLVERNSVPLTLEQPGARSRRTEVHRHHSLYGC